MLIDRKLRALSRAARRALLVGLAVASSALLVLTPARADDDRHRYNEHDDHARGDHERRDHAWREHDRRENWRDDRRFYQRPDVYYSAPPVVYPPPVYYQQPGVTLHYNYPLPR